MTSEKGIFQNKRWIKVWNTTKDSELDAEVSDIVDGLLVKKSEKEFMDWMKNYANKKYGSSIESFESIVFKRNNIEELSKIPALTTSIIRKVTLALFSDWFKDKNIMKKNWKRS